VRTVASRQVVVAVNDSAKNREIRSEMTLAEARAICAQVQHVEHDPYKDAVALEALGRWMMRFSPVVSLLLPLPLGEGRGEGVFAKQNVSHNQNPLTPALSLWERGPDQDALFLDVTGSEKVFHGFQNLIVQISSALTRFRITAAIAIAPTPGAAWAMTFSAGHVGRVVTQKELPAALNALPPFVLRLDPQIVESLHHLGLERIEQIEKLPREQLPARFGEELLRRLDQAFGRVHEPLVALEPFTPIAARMDFEAPIDSLETIWLVFKRLIEQVVPELAKRGRGARELDLEFFRPYDTPIHQTIRLSRASRDPVNWFNLMRCVVEGMEGEARRHKDTKARRGEKGMKGKVHSLFPSSWSPLRASVPSCLRAYERISPSGFIAIRLSVRVSERISEEQIALLDHEQFNGEIELSHLVERLRVRMGRESVVQVELVESHLPELAFRDMGLRRAQSTRILLMRDSENTGEMHMPRSIRPLRLVPNPEEIRVIVTPSDDLDGKPFSFTTRDGTVHRLEHALGPERIAGRWWAGHDKIRDYFDVEDTTGKRFWIFRVLQSARWFVHGYFQ
jgi:protein ImuB